MKLCKAGGVVDWLSVEQNLHPIVMDYWEAFDVISPIGDTRDDQRSAVQTAWFVQAMTTGDKPRNPDEFLCFREPTAESWAARPRGGADDEAAKRERARREQNSLR